MTERGAVGLVWPRARTPRSPAPLATATLTVAVVGDSEGVVPRVRTLLHREGVSAQVEYGGRGHLALGRLRRRPDVVVLADSSVQSGASEANRIRRRIEHTHVVAVLAEDGTRDAAQMLNAGVDGVVAANAVEATLGLVVRSVCSGLVSMPKAMRHGVDPPAFSHRERQILALVVAGLTNEEIAAQLYVAESTVKGHLTSAFRRLGARSRRDAVALILTGDESLRRTVLTASPAPEAHEPARGG
jgi:DNA-binding NarL/FixJ family response regulator